MISKRQPIKVSPNQLIQDLNWVSKNPSLLDPSVLNEVDIKPLNDVQKLRIHQLGPIELVSPKLGFYFEALIRLWIQVSEKYTLKVANLQVQKAKETIGEFDFIVENIEARIHEHWEVSVKFYLCHDPNLEFKGCCGTQLKDVFEEKVSKLKNHQLKLSQTEPAIETLSKLEIEIEQSSGLLKGMIFYHVKLGQFTNESLNPYSVKGIWMYHSEWTNKPEGLFLILKKPFLFSLNSYSENDALTSAEIHKTFEEEMHPLMIVDVLKDGQGLKEVSRIWLIPDGWF